MGRPKKSGKRTKTGRLATVHDYGNAKVQSRAELFRHFGGDSGRGTEMTCAGRLMLVGALDGLEFDPSVCLQALQNYAFAYWGHYHGGPKIATYERQDRGQDNSTHDDPDMAGEWFDRIDELLRDMGHSVRMAVHDCTVNRHWFPDEDADWAARIINSRMVDKRLLPSSVEQACDSDWAMLELLRLGAQALARGTGQAQRRAA
jgi:hypothetical protein